MAGRKKRPAPKARSKPRTRPKGRESAALRKLRAEVAKLRAKLRAEKGAKPKATKAKAGIARKAPKRPAKASARPTEPKSKPARKRPAKAPQRPAKASPHSTEPKAARKKRKPAKAPRRPAERPPERITVTEPTVREAVAADRAERAARRKAQKKGAAWLTRNLKRAFPTRKPAAVKGAGRGRDARGRFAAAGDAHTPKETLARDLALLADKEALAFTYGRTDTASLERKLRKTFDRQNREWVSVEDALSHVVGHIIFLRWFFGDDRKLADAAIATFLKAVYGKQGGKR